MSQANPIKETREFQTETKQLLDLMIHSIYTNREIFLRELISNASDAIDKLRFAALTDQELLEGKDGFEILVTPNEEHKTLTITDNGIGMTFDEVVENIGTIAKSGTKAFMEKLKESGGTTSAGDLIGQFGVGFYSAFMVAKKVTVLTRAPGENNGVRWESSGDGTYTIEEYPKDNHGTTLILELKDEHCASESANDNFLNRYTLQNIVKKYSDYIRYPIKMEFTNETPALDDDGKPIADAKPIKTIEIETVNSMIPLWAKNKNDITAEEYNDLYKNLFLDWEEPLEIIHSKVEGLVEYTTVLFIPSRAPFDFYQRESTAGIRLYSRNVFIMESHKDFLPEYLRFVRGLVDSPDLSLNISRELLQQSAQMQKIGKNLEKSVLKTLESMLKNDHPKYDKFWKEYGTAIKSGLYADYANRDKLQDLVLFPSSHSIDTMTTLAEYVKRMPEAQQIIYYAAGKDRSAVEHLPHMEIIRDKGFEVLYLIERVDEFAIEAMHEYKGKKFQSISRGNLNLDDTENKETKEAAENIGKENIDMLKAIQNNLEGKIAEAKISHRLKTSPVCLISDDGGISLSMEKILSELDKTPFKARRIMELNPEHKVFARLKSIYENNPESAEFKDTCELLYGQALLMEGILPDDPAGFAAKVALLMAEKQ